MATLPIVTFTLLVAQRLSAAHAIITNLPPDSITAQAAIASSAPLLYRIAAALDHSMPLPARALWFTGVLLLFGRLCMGLFVARRMKSLATEPPTPDLLLTFRHLVSALESLVPFAFFTPPWFRCLLLSAGCGPSCSSLSVVSPASRPSRSKPSSPTNSPTSVVTTSTSSASSNPSSRRCSSINLLSGGSHTASASSASTAVTTWPSRSAATPSPTPAPSRSLPSSR